MRDVNIINYLELPSWSLLSETCQLNYHLSDQNVLFKPYTIGKTIKALLK